MKVNTDGVLLGVLVETEKPTRILDIGTGTGVIALILAQRFPSADITAVEIDEAASSAAANNFSGSVFNARLRAVHSSFSSYFQGDNVDKFDLIISNPPFFIDSLKSNDVLKGVARHTDQLFFESMIRDSALKLQENGVLALILPVLVSALVQKLAAQAGLNLQKKTGIYSFSDSLPHREILIFGFDQQETSLTKFVIYAKPKEYSLQYRAILKDFLTIF